MNLTPALFNDLSLPLSGYYFRSVPYLWHQTPLSGMGSKKQGQRYNARDSFEALYLGDAPDTVLYETRALIMDPANTGSFLIPPQGPRVHLTIDVSLQQTVNLTATNVRAAIGLHTADDNDITGEWTTDLAAGRVPLTQIIGQSAQNAGIEGLLFPSARKRGSNVLVVFNENLRKPSFIEVYESGSITGISIARIDGI